jgi:hypothetical protein
VGGSQIEIWDVRLEHWLECAGAKANRKLTADERDRYLGNAQMGRTGEGLSEAAFGAVAMRCAPVLSRRDSDGDGFYDDEDVEPYSTWPARYVDARGATIDADAAELTGPHRAVHYRVEELTKELTKGLIISGGVVNCRAERPSTVSRRRNKVPKSAG